MGSEPNSSFLSRSRQRWKLDAMVWMMVVGGAMLLVGIARELWLTVHPVAVLVILASLFWGARTVRCPKCGSRLFWKALSEQTPSRFVIWLIQLQMCPTCGSDGRD